MDRSDDGWRPDTFQIPVRASLVLAFSDTLVALELTTSRDPSAIPESRVALLHHALLCSAPFRRPDGSRYPNVAVRLEFLALGMGVTTRFDSEPKPGGWSSARLPRTWHAGRVARTLGNGAATVAIRPRASACQVTTRRSNGGRGNGAPLFPAGQPTAAAVEAAVAGYPFHLPAVQDPLAEDAAFPEMAGVFTDQAYHAGGFPPSQQAFVNEFSTRYAATRPHLFDLFRWPGTQARLERTQPSLLRELHLALLLDELDHRAARRVVLAVHTGAC